MFRTSWYSFSLRAAWVVVGELRGGVSANGAFGGGETRGMLGLDRVRETADSDMESSSSLI